MTVPPTLAGASAARVIRALLDFRSVWTTHDLVALSRVPAPTIHRVVGILENQQLVTRTAGAVVAVPDWLALLRRWSVDFRFTDENTLTHWEAVGGTDALLQRIPQTPLPYAVTGTTAAREWVPTSPAGALTIYSPDAHKAAEAWNLLPASAGDVVLATPATDVVYSRPRKADSDLRLAAPSQVLADLVTGAGITSPTAAQHLQSWMEAHEFAWRY